MSALRAVYDFQTWQPSYTIVNFLMGAEYERLKRGDQHIDVEFVPAVTDVGLFPRYKYWPRTQAECTQCMSGIVLPMVDMLPSVNSVTVHEKRPVSRVYDFSLGNKFTNAHYVGAYADGVRPLRLKDKPKVDRKLITMTFRECGKKHWQVRDTDRAKWLHAAHLLKVLGYRVVIVRDTERADEKLPGFDTSPLCSRDLGHRAWLYLSAGVNLFVSNGPCWFALALDAPTIIFRPTCDEANKNSHSDSMAAFGIVRDRQMAGAPAHQRLCWLPDNSENLVCEATRFLLER